MAAAAAKAFLLPDTDKEACKRVWILTLTDAICLYPGGCLTGARAVLACCRQGCSTVLHAAMVRFLMLHCCLQTHL